MFSFIPELLFLLLIAYSDYKYREVPLLYYIGVIGAGMLSNYMTHDAIIHPDDFLVNLLIIFTIFGLSYCYIKLFHGANTRFINGYIGTGDLVFSLFLIIRFDPIHFLFFFIGSLISSLLIMMFILRKTQSVPLAGIQALCMFVLILIYSLCGIDWFMGENIFLKA